MKELLLSTLLFFTPIFTFAGQNQIQSSPIKTIVMGKEIIQISRENYTHLSSKLNEVAYDSMEMTTVYCESPRYSHVWEIKKKGKGKLGPTLLKTIYVTTRFTCRKALNEFLEGETCKLEKFDYGWDITYCDK